MVILITLRAIAKMATIVMANGNFSMAIRRIQLKSMKKTSSVVFVSHQSNLLFRGN